MDKINWNLITSGEQFESLMHSLLYASNKEIHLFGRPGRDAAQDACSKDGSVIYQAKYRKNPDLVAIAKGELKSIAKYRKRGHANNKYWEKAKTVVFYVNIRMNPNIQDKWDSEVSPLYLKEGLNVGLRSLEQIDNELHEFPHLIDAYFEHNTDLYYSVNEAIEYLKSNNKYTSESFSKTYVGREKEEEIIRKFLGSDKKILPVYGKFGIGKKRLLLESLSLCDDYRGIWGLPDAMNKGEWLQFFPSKTLIAIDMTESNSLLAGIVEQLNSKRFANIKLIMAFNQVIDFEKFKLNAHFHEPIQLSHLNEKDSLVLLNEYAINHYI
ncbi:MAG: hypothetical protein LBV04_02740 [Deferribacteraceae bacterium]|jgi:hypothetical protein|nr:hypothetical protein [Deferribacteraceae bacterium]